VTHVLSRHVDPCGTDVGAGQRAGIIATTPPQCRTGVAAEEVRATGALGFGVAYEWCKRDRRVVADDDMHVVGKNCLGVNAHATTATGLKHRCGDFRHISPANGPLPPPRMPGDVRVQPARFMGPTFPHKRDSGWANPGVAPRGSCAHGTHGWVDPGPGPGLCTAGLLACAAASAARVCTPAQAARVRNPAAPPRGEPTPVRNAVGT
jgi:hypothetical protein